jgi:hypothetical protein
MDNEALSDLSHNPGNRQFWIVLWGDPDVDENQGPMVYADEVIEHWFPLNLTSLRMGDICFVHRIKKANLIFVGETISEVREATQGEIAAQYKQGRWKWVADFRNLTPTFGTYWRGAGLRTFGLNKEYNQLNPHDQVNIGALQRGRPVRISPGFAQFLANQIISL